MLFRPDRPERLAGIADQIRAAARPSTDLVATIASEVSRDGVTSPAPVAGRIANLITAQAWTDAALALVASELPQWKLRRLAYDDGEWYCILAPQREFPEWLDDGIEVHHADLSLSLFKGLVEAARQQRAKTSKPTVPRVRVRQPDTLCCDNFA